MPRPTALVFGVVLGLLLAGCASAPTPYQAAQGGFGYSEQQIEENRYRVSFAGNSATTRQTVEDYLLYRAAELTVQTGHDWFQVVDRNTAQEYSGSGGSPEMGVGVGSGGNFGVGMSFPVLGGGGGSGAIRRAWTSSCARARSRRKTPPPTTPSRSSAGCSPRSSRAAPEAGRGMLIASARISKRIGLLATAARVARPSWRRCTDGAAAGNRTRTAAVVGGPCMPMRRFGKVPRNHRNPRPHARTAHL